jgi:hypothetical protein
MFRLARMWARVGQGSRENCACAHVAFIWLLQLASYISEKHCGVFVLGLGYTSISGSLFSVLPITYQGGQVGSQAALNDATDRGAAEKSMQTSVRFLPKEGFTDASVVLLRRLASCRPHRRAAFSVCQMDQGARWEWWALGRR